MDIKAIETVYNGYRFRSRLEARWAVFFDAMGVEYQYEPEGYDLGEAGYYLPDFYLQKYNAFIEIKGQPASGEEITKIAEMGKMGSGLVFLFSGLPSPTIEAEYTNWEGFIAVISDGPPEKRFANLFLSKTSGDEAPQEWGIMTVCPVCKHEYVHFEDAVNDYGEDKAGSAWHGRGEAIKIPMWCESGHSWTLRIGFHKGNTYANIERIRYLNLWFLVFLSRDSSGCIYNACDKAKQARFEHGENGGF